MTSEATALTEQQLSGLLSGAVANGLLSTSSLKIAPYTGLYDVDRWLDDYEDVSEATRWNDTQKCQKLPAYLTGVARDWYQLHVKNNAELNSDWTA